MAGGYAPSRSADNALALIFSPLFAVRDEVRAGLRPKTPSRRCGEQRHRAPASQPRLRIDHGLEPGFPAAGAIGLDREEPCIAVVPFDLDYALETSGGMA